MKRGLLAIAALLAVPAIASGQSTVTEIDVEDDEFAPPNVTSNVGEESFRWQWGPGKTINEHNVRQESDLFTSGGPAFTDELTVTPSAGKFLYVCDVHGFIAGGRVNGMGGSIAVKPTATPQGKRVLVTWATEATDTGTQFDVKQRVGKQSAKVVESKTKALEGVFKLKAGAKYQFQARSRQGDAVSGWSPKLTVKG